MSTTLLQFKFRVGGVLTAATSVVLSDATGTYGARRTDTLATVVADATAMTAVSTGVYEYSFTDPAAGLTYQWVAEVVYSGTTLRFQFTTDGGSGDNFTGRYTTYAMLTRRFGTTNVQTWSNTEGGSTVNTTAIEDAIEGAEDEIDAYFTNSIYEIPFDATGATLPHTLREWATVLAGYWLYTKRGFSDAKPGNDLKALVDAAYVEMAAYKSGIRTLPGVTIDGTNAPVFARPERINRDPRFGLTYARWWW